MSLPVDDLVLIGGTIVDGHETPAWIGDVAIRGDRIVAVGELEASRKNRAEHRLDCHGLVISPGFIDVHTHDDGEVLRQPDMPAKISQGVTTVITGNCGISLGSVDGRAIRAEAPVAPLNLLGAATDFQYDTMAAYREAVDRTRPAVNVGALVGHISLRVSCMPDPHDVANLEQRRAMAARVDEAMRAGALGFSTGLFYASNRSATAAEVTELARHVARAGGVYTTHMRDEMDGVLEALHESFETGRESGARVIISHHKCAGPNNWGRSPQTLAAIDDAARSIDVALDAYPYRAGSTVIIPELADGTIDVLISNSEAHPEMRGRRLDTIARQWGVDQREAARRLMPGGAIYFQMHEDDVRRILQHPRTMIGSDGLPSDPIPILDSGGLFRACWATTDATKACLDSRPPSTK